MALTGRDTVALFLVALNVISGWEPANVTNVAQQNVSYTVSEVKRTNNNLSVSANHQEDLFQTSSPPLTKTDTLNVVAGLQSGFFQEALVFTQNETLTTSFDAHSSHRPRSVALNESADLIVSLGVPNGSTQMSKSPVTASFVSKSSVLAADISHYHNAHGSDSFSTETPGSSFSSPGIPSGVQNNPAVFNLSTKDIAVCAGERRKIEIDADEGVIVLNSHAGNFSDDTFKRRPSVDDACVIAVKVSSASVVLLQAVDQPLPCDWANGTSAYYSHKLEVLEGSHGSQLKMAVGKDCQIRPIYSITNFLTIVISKRDPPCPSQSSCSKAHNVFGQSLLLRFSAVPASERPDLEVRYSSFTKGIVHQ
ncbi:hypothetical protein BaRGS_00019962 [Batillaria attramentaria]|uniref:Uncharacterized protein n=1 Tax=Batillaria attramentaria TaxID=370345 RepID=A0ABD0KNX4_9CAEN